MPGCESGDRMRDLLAMMIFSKEETGFTLLEVMVSLSIVAVVLVSLLISQTQNVSLQDEIKFKTTAALLAQKKISDIEQIKSGNLDSDSGDFGDDFPDYAWEIDVQEFTLPDGISLPSDADDYTQYLKQIDVTIYRGEQKRSRYNVKYYKFVP
jgi:general secretion pathway protein I